MQKVLCCGAFLGINYLGGRLGCFLPTALLSTNDLFWPSSESNNRSLSTPQFAWGPPFLCNAFGSSSDWRQPSPTPSASAPQTRPGRPKARPGILLVVMPEAVSVPWLILLCLPSQALMYTFTAHGYRAGYNPPLARGLPKCLSFEMSLGYVARYLQGRS